MAGWEKRTISRVFDAIRKFEFNIQEIEADAGQSVDNLRIGAVDTVLRLWGSLLEAGNRSDPEPLVLKKWKDAFPEDTELIREYIWYRIKEITEQPLREDDDLHSEIVYGVFPELCRLLVETCGEDISGLENFLKEVVQVAVKVGNEHEYSPYWMGTVLTSFGTVFGRLEDLCPGFTGRQLDYMIEHLPVSDGFLASFCPHVFFNLPSDVRNKPEIKQKIIETLARLNSGERRQRPEIYDRSYYTCLPCELIYACGNFDKYESLGEDERNIIAGIIRDQSRLLVSILEETSNSPGRSLYLPDRVVVFALEKIARRSMFPNAFAGISEDIRKEITEAYRKLESLVSSQENQLEFAP